MRDNRTANRPGFTMVELLVVVAIIGLLAGISVVAYRSTLMTFRGVTAKNQMDGIVNALEQYKIKYGEYPPDGTDDNAVKRHVLKRWPELLKLGKVDDVVNTIQRDYHRDSAENLFFWLCGPDGLGFPVNPGVLLDESGANPVMDKGSEPRDTPFITLVYDDASDNTNSGNASLDFVFVYRDMPIYYFRAEKNGYNGKSCTTGGYGTVAPYQKDGKWLNSSTYQLIHPGEDGSFTSLADDNTNPRDITDSATCTPEDQDNIVNFGEGTTLGSAQ